MRRAAGIWATVLLLGWATCANAQPDQRRSISATSTEEGVPVAADWQAICLSHRNDFDQAERMAADRGWMLAPDGIVPPLAKAVGKPRVWLRKSARGLEILAFGRMVDGPVDGGPKFPARFCGVAAAPPQVGVADAVEMLLSVPPNTSEVKSGQATFVYRRTSAGPAPIMGDLKDPAVIQAAETSDVDFVQIQDGAEATIVLLAVPDGR